jgi:hypothetical protein
MSAIEPITRKRPPAGQPTVELSGNEIRGYHNWEDWSRRAPFSCGTCGAVSNFPCHHQRALQAGDHVRVQLAEASFEATVRVIEAGEHGGIADVEPDDSPGALVTVTFGPQADSQITPAGAAA